MTGLILRPDSGRYPVRMKSVCETGIVKSVGQGTAMVRLTGEASCKKCGLAALGLCKSGGAGYELEATCHIPVKVGQKVRVVRGGSGYSDGGFMGYGLPVLALMLGAVAGHMAADYLGVPAEATGVAVGLTAMLVSYIPVWIWGRRKENSRHFMPHIETLDPFHHSAGTKR